FFVSSRRRHTRFSRDWSSDVCSSDLAGGRNVDRERRAQAESGVEMVVHLHVVAAVPPALLGDLVLERVCDLLADREAGEKVLREIGRASCREGVWKCGRGERLEERRD